MVGKYLAIQIYHLFIVFNEMTLEQRVNEHDAGKVDFSLGSLINWC